MGRYHSYSIVPYSHATIPTQYYLIQYFLLNPTQYYLIPTQYYLIPTQYYLIRIAECSLRLIDFPSARNAKIPPNKQRRMFLIRILLFFFSYILECSLFLQTILEMPSFQMHHSNAKKACFFGSSRSYTYRTGTYFGSCICCFS